MAALVLTKEAHKTVALVVVDLQETVTVVEEEATVAVLEQVEVRTTVAVVDLLAMVLLQITN
jgi:hypothetical protein